MDAYPHDLILHLCKKYGPLLHVPHGVNGVALMAAIAIEESSFGNNCKPRYERSYDRGGANDRNEQTALLDEYGMAAAYSYGPWQIMPCNAASNISPAELYSNPETCAMAFVTYMNRRILGHLGATTVQQIAESYNGGHFRGTLPDGVLRYAEKVVGYYTNAATKFSAELEKA